jgi:DNA topoisomerase-1
VCRKCYVHPAIIESYLDGSMVDAVKQRVDAVAEEQSDLQADEAQVMRLLQARLAEEAPAARKAG